MSELKLKTEDWKSISDCVESILNYVLFKRCGMRNSHHPSVYRTPSDVFTNKKPSTRLLTSLPVHQYVYAAISEIQGRQVMEIEQTEEALEAIHRGMIERMNSRRKRHRGRSNGNTYLHTINCHTGELVIVRDSIKLGHKLSQRWSRSSRITRARSANVFQITDLLKEKSEIAHAKCMLLCPTGKYRKGVTP